MRGKGVSFAYAEALAGITPAYAGKSMTRFISHRHTTDHPRLCGEKHIILVCNLMFVGSPPPMRGKGQGHAKRVEHRRITPAYAGKSRYTIWCRCCNRDHPRLCGEKPQTSASPETHAGSPPPMRGKASTISPPLVVFRITPAYAGKSRSKRLFWLLEQDHPRLCGEKHV